jgi:hypothetical protein
MEVLSRDIPRVCQVRI